MKPSALTPILTLRDHTFLPSSLGKESTVVDLGANLGDFSRGIVELFHCRCIAVEPNPVLFEQARAVPGVEAVWAAVSDREGTVELTLSDNPEASTILANRAPQGANGSRVQVPAITLESLLGQLNVTHVDLLKVDIEGAEISMLLSAPEAVLRSIDQITLEFHDFCGLVTPAQVSAVLSRLDALGFGSVQFNRWNNTDWLFARRDAAALTPLRRAYLEHLARIRWVKRKFARLSWRLRTRRLTGSTGR